MKVGMISCGMKCEMKNNVMQYAESAKESVSVLRGVLAMPRQEYKAQQGTVQNKMYKKKNEKIK